MKVLKVKLTRIALVVIGVALVTSALISTNVFASAVNWRVSVNGFYVDLRDTSLQYIDSRIMIPIRPLVEALGGEVTFDGVNRRFLITWHGRYMLVPLDLDISYFGHRSAFVRYG